MSLLVETGQINDILPPERICALRMGGGRNRRLILSWSEAELCYPFSDEDLQYRVTYGNITEGTVQTSQLINELEFTVEGVSNIDMYYFQVTAVIASTILGPFSQCLNVTVGMVSNDITTPTCKEIMYECAHQDPSTTSDETPTTTVASVPTFDTMATVATVTSLQTGSTLSSTYSTPTEPPDVTHPDIPTGTSTDNSTTDSRSLLQGKIWITSVLCMYDSKLSLPSKL